MPKRIFFFSDIDDTLIQTKRKTDFSKKTIVASYTKEGEESSYFYEGVKLFVLNFGGLLLVDNQEDKAWTKQMQESYRKVTALDSLYTQASKHFENDNIKLQIKIIDSYYISIYNKFDLDNQEMLSKIRNSLKTFLDKESDFYLYENGNSFAILPNFLNKKFAVEHLIKIHRPLLSIGAGDNISDLDFMQSADFKFLPDKCFI